MQHSDGDPRDPSRPPPGDADASVEISSPIADCMRALARAIQETRGSLAGASIARSRQGTLILNPAAWQLFGADLRRDVPDLVVIDPAREPSGPLRFLLVTTPLPPLPDPG